MTKSSDAGRARGVLDPTTNASKRHSTPRCCFEDDEGRRICRRAQYELLQKRPYCADHATMMRQRVLDEAVKGNSAARQWTGMSVAQVKEYEALVTDPALLDPRNPLALHRMLLNEVLLPSDDLVERYAYSVAALDWHLEAPEEFWDHGELMLPRPLLEHVKPVHREQARRKLTKEGIGLLRGYQEATNDAAKIAKIEDALNLRVMPLLQGLGQAIGAAADEHITDPKVRARLLDAVKRAGAQAAAGLAALAEELKR